MIVEGLGGGRIIPDGLGAARIGGRGRFWQWLTFRTLPTIFGYFGMELGNPSLEKREERGLSQKSELKGSRTAKNTECSTGPLARPFPRTAHSWESEL